MEAHITEKILELNGGFSSKPCLIAGGYRKNPEFDVKSEE